MTRREALLAAAGFIAAGARGEEKVPAGSAGGDTLLAALPGKSPLIQRAFRPPNFETPIADLVPLYTSNGAFFVRYHLPVIPWVDAASWRLHDLRRTCASRMQKLGISVPVIESALNHTSGTFRGIVGVYQQHDYADEIRAAFQKWGDHVERLVEGKPAKVIALREARP